MDIHARTLTALDWHAILERLSHYARTQRGHVAAATPDFAPDRDAALARYAAVAEVLGLEEEGDRVPVGGVTDVGPATDRAARGQILDAPDLVAVGASLRSLVYLRRWLLEKLERAPTLAELADPIDVDPELLSRLETSFDESGQLSGITYPELGALRTQIQSLHKRVRSTLDELIRGDGLGGALQDRFVTERNGRYVLPIKANQRKGVGIVHDTSQSGETVFVEPAQVVELHNRLREVEGALRREERRILAALSNLVGRFQPEIEAALDQAVAIDLACARADLGAELKATIPQIESGGTILLQGARHPVLQLRGVPVVPNDLALDAARPGLVLTGPNTGGKTIAMKTLGLAALMVRAGIPVPTAPGSRVDFLPTVLADVGDLQSVEGDLSTFSGHLTVLRGVLEAIGPGALVLLDEVAVGTDPAQGAALARAALERIVDAGARVVVTTHYAELKALGAVDGRFVIAAMQYQDGRPTYRMRRGLAGQSHALSTARRMGLPEPLVRRAEGLLDTNARDLAALLERLDDELQETHRQQAELHVERERLASRQEALEQRERRLQERIERVERDLAEGFQRRMAAREQEVIDMVAALQADPGMARAGRTLEEIRGIRRGARIEREAPPPPPPAEIQIGDEVFVRPLGRSGRVVSISGEQVEVEVGALRTRIRRRDLGAERRPAASKKAPRSDPGGARTVDRGRRGRPPATSAAEIFAGRASPQPTPSEQRAAAAGGPVGVRLPGNSCDLRGKRVDEAIELADRFLDHQILLGSANAYILHGHGTGAIKQALRAWLPTAGYAGRWRPGDEVDGGDAWTVVTL